MAITECISLSVENKIDNNFSEAALHINETGYHGTPEFPVAIYLDDVSNKYVNWHWHEEFEIGFVTEGSVILGCGNRSYQMECGDIFFINSNVLHSMHRNSSHKFAIFKSIAFHSSLISDNVTSIFYTKYLFPILSNVHFKECIINKEQPAYQSILEILENIWDDTYFENTDYELKVRNGLSTLFGILNQIRKNAEKITSLQTSNYLPEKRVQILLDYIHTYYKEKITIESLSKKASVSKTEVLRCFKSIIGVSPIHYLNNYRLQRAAHLLINTDNNIQEIAVDCGFDDNSYFSKLFRKKYHVTPHDYRFQKRKSHNAAINLTL